MPAVLDSVSTIECDVLVVGGSCAALRAALEAKKQVDNVVIASKRRIGGSGNSIVSTSFFSAVIPGKGVEDTFEKHFNDSQIRAKYLCDDELLEIVVRESPERVLEVEDWGIRLHRTPDGELYRRPDHPGECEPRGIRPEYTVSGLGVGASFTRPFADYVKSKGVRFVESTPIVKLLTRDGVIRGAVGLDLKTQRAVVFQAKAVVMAAGGGGAIYEATTNTGEMTGDAFSLCIDAGAQLRDMEFELLHVPILTWPAKVTLRDNVFRNGGVLRNRHGDTFVDIYDPATKKTKPRELLVIDIADQLQKGNGVDGGVYLDCTQVAEDVPASPEYGPLAPLARKRGVDVRKEWLIVAPGGHFVSGGLAIDADGGCNVPGLYGAGEATGGVNGALKIGGNAMSETLVFGARAGAAAAAYARSLAHIPEGSFEPASLVPSRNGGTDVAELTKTFKRAMSTGVSAIRSARSLTSAMDVIHDVQEELQRAPVHSFSDVAAYCELAGMCLTGLAIAESALARTETRGWHYRSDFPATDDERWLGNVYVQMEGSGRMATEYRPKRKLLWRELSGE